MMPLGLPVGMVPPPMLGHHGGMPGFPGMAGLPGMPMMGMLAPGLGVGGPPMGGPGLLGDMPPSGMPNLSQLNNMQQQLNSGLVNMDKSQNDRSADDDEKRRQHEGRREGK